jgi:hypothetical protein
MRLRWANNISTFLRSRRATRPFHERAIWRAMSKGTFVDRSRHVPDRLLNVPWIAALLELPGQHDRQLHFCVRASCGSWGATFARP